MATPEKVARLHRGVTVQVALDELKPEELKTATVVRHLEGLSEDVQVKLADGHNASFPPARVFYNGASLTGAPVKAAVIKRKAPSKEPSSSPSAEKIEPPAKRSKPTPDTDDHEATVSASAQETHTFTSTTATRESTTEPHAAAAAAEPTEIHATSSDLNGASETTQPTSTLTQSTASATLPSAAGPSSQAASSINSVPQSQTPKRRLFEFNGRSIHHPNSSRKNLGDPKFPLSRRMDDVISDLEEYSTLNNAFIHKLSKATNLWEYLTRIVRDHFNKYERRPEVSARQINDFKWQFLRAKEAIEEAKLEKWPKISKKFKKKDYGAAIDPVRFDA